MASGSTDLNLSIVVPMYQTENDVLRKCLSSLKYIISKESGYEVIVVDSSSRSSDSLVQEILPAATYVKHPTRLYVGAARNKGLSLARFDHILFFDSDCLMTQDWINSYRVLIKDGIDWISASGFVGFEDIRQEYALAFHIWEFHDFLGERSGESRFSIGCNLLCKRSLFEKVGGFKEDWSHCEDFELFSRPDVQRLKKKILFIPDLKIIHQAHLVDRAKLLAKATFMGSTRKIYDSSLNSFSMTSRWLFRPLQSVLFLIFPLLILWRLSKSRSQYLGHALALIGLITSYSRAWQKGFATSESGTPSRLGKP